MAMGRQRAVKPIAKKAWSRSSSGKRVWCGIRQRCWNGLDTVRLNGLDYPSPFVGAAVVWLPKVLGSVSYVEMLHTAKRRETLFGLRDISTVVVHRILQKGLCHVQPFEMYGKLLLMCRDIPQHSGIGNAGVDM
jgi:hypothetical protein